MRIIMDHIKRNISKKLQNDGEQLRILVEESITRDRLYMRQHLTIKDLSLVTGISQLRLHTLFGCGQNYNTLNTYINRHFRVPKVAKLLIEEPAYSVEAVGHDSGYHNMKTFFTWFRNETGFTPGNYRDAVLTNRLKPEDIPATPHL